MNNLLKNQAEIKARTEAKRKKIVAWLIDEVYSEYQTIAKMLDVTAATSYKTLKAMERDGLLDAHKIGGRTFFSLTMLAQIEALADGGEVAGLFDPRVSEVTTRHTLAVQAARITAEAAGCTGWISERSMRRSLAKGGATPWLKVPDGVVTDLKGRRVAIEVERTPKTPKRYAEVMGAYLQMRKAGTVEEVHYVCHGERLAAGLKRVFASFETIKIRGTVVPLKQEHHEMFSFFDLADWTQVLTGQQRI